MYDTIHSSYDLGEHFTDVELQTKDIECIMSHYWLDPHGYLYSIDYSDTADFIQLKEGDKGYNSVGKFLNFIWKSNGNKGKVSPCYLTKYIEVYPAQWESSYDEWPRCRIHFKYGRLIDFEYLMPKN